MKKLILILLLCVSSPALSDELTPDMYTPGLHLLAGGGLNSSVYSSQYEHIEGGVGLNLKTDLVYYFDSIWAVDAGSSVKFNRVDGMLLWDTQFTFGVRRNLPEIGFGKLEDPYVRVFLGRAPTVVFLNGESDVRVQSLKSDVNRVQYDGPVYGLTLGNMARTSKGTIWFSELSLTYQTLDHESEIKMDGEVPTVLYEGPAEPGSKIYTITFSVGVMVF